MLKKIVPLFLLILFTLINCLALPAQVRVRKAVFKDEFNGPAGSSPDSSKWISESGGGGWGNQELEYYIDSTANAYLDGHGVLVIKAEKLTPPLTLACWYGPCLYTSARLITKGKFDLAYGRFEARIKIPRGQGVWPAFWMLGNNIDRVGWPQCGEIDIMENIGREPAVNHGSIHGPGYSGGNSVSGIYTLAGNNLFSDDFHVFTLDWSSNEVRWYVDGINYKTATPQGLPTGATWIFDHPFFLILNFAVGGGWPGSPDSTTVFPQTMLIDYVRVYKR